MKPLTSFFFIAAMVLLNRSVTVLRAAASSARAGTEAIPVSIKRAAAAKKALVRMCMVGLSLIVEDGGECANRRIFFLQKVDSCRTGRRRLRTSGNHFLGGGFRGTVTQAPEEKQRDGQHEEDEDLCM